MDGAGHQFLACAGFADDEHRGVGWSHGFYHFLHPADGGGIAHNGPAPAFRAELRVFGLEPAVFQGTAQGQLEHIKIQRLDQIVICSGLQRLHCAFHSGIGGHEHHRHGGVVTFDALEGGDAVHVRHADIHKHRVKRSLTNFFHGLDAVGGALHTVAPFAQQGFQHEAVAVVVIHNQN